MSFVNRAGTVQGLRDPSWLDEVANYASTGGKIVTDAYGVYRDVTATNQNTGAVPPDVVIPTRPDVITPTHSDGGGTVPQPGGGGGGSSTTGSSPTGSGDGKILGMEPLTAGLIAGGIILAFIFLSD